MYPGITGNVASVDIIYSSVATYFGNINIGHRERLDTLPLPLPLI